MLQMALADGARPVHSRDKGPARYGRTMELYQSIRKANPEAAKGISEFGLLKNLYNDHKITFIYYFNSINML